MNKTSEENNPETSPSPSQSLLSGEISTGEKSDNNISIPLDLQEDILKILPVKSLMSVNNIYIPHDIQVEILKFLPVKSLMRFRCVSKEWSSTIDSRQDFIDSILYRSLAQPQSDTYLIFDIRSKKLQDSHSFIFSSTCPQNPENQSVSSPGPFHEYVRGLILCWDEKPSAVAIYNPTTRQSIALPKMDSLSMYLRLGRCFLGYDPVENQYKVLCIRKRWKQSCHVYTLGDPTKAWRNIPCDIELPNPVFCSVCINGTIYYLGKTVEHSSTYVLMSFDVRTETFNPVMTPKANMCPNSTLINYQGKLGCMSCYADRVEIWVMEDAKTKKEWSNIFVNSNKGFDKGCVTGVTRCGEIILVVNWVTIRFFCYDPKRSKLTQFDAESIPVDDVTNRDKYIDCVWAVPDHVENTMRL